MTPAANLRAQTQIRGWTTVDDQHIEKLVRGIDMYATRALYVSHRHPHMRRMITRR
jgi:hypothetical protein